MYVSRFLRSTALEMHLDDDVTSQGVLAPRFIGGIADEVDIIEDKKAGFRKYLSGTVKSELSLHEGFRCT